MDSQTRTYPFQFTGNGGEYFRIWIVNLALTLLTLGIYSAWAKVRRKRYFNNHTFLDGHNFDYVADPVAILKGRLIAAVLFVAYALSQQFAPLLSPLLMLLFLLGMPWIVTRSLQFNARNSTHRGLRFAFNGRIGEAVRVYVLWGLLSLVTLGLAIPYAAYRKTGFFAGNHAYGATQGRYAGRPKDFYRAYLPAFALLLLPLGWMFYAISSIPAVPRGARPSPEAVSAMAQIGFAVFALYASLPFVIGYLRARTASLLFAGTQLGDLGFDSRFSARRLVWLYVSNLILIALTLGFFAPWAEVRMARFWLDNLSITGPEAGLGQFVVEAGSNVAATGSEMADVFDVDIALA